MRPALVQIGARELYAAAPYDRAIFMLSPFGQCRVTLRRVAKIKVRRFGSAYRVDDRVDYADRWARADIPGLLNELRHPKAQWQKGLQAVLLVSFGREAEPFEREVAALGSSMQGLEFETRAWPDRYGRAFSVGLMAWWRVPAGFAA